MGDDATVTLGPLDMGDFIEGMRVAWISDPEGNIVELNQGYEDETEPAAARSLTSPRPSSAGGPSRSARRSTTAA